MIPETKEQASQVGTHLTPMDINLGPRAGAQQGSPGLKARFYVGLIGLFVVSSTLGLALWSLVPAVIPGWTSAAITSGSMAPSIRSGDVVVASAHDGVGLSPGAVVLIADPDGSGLITHRIIALNPDGSYVTAGDANPQVDSTPLLPDQVIGVGQFLVPFIGLPVTWYGAGAWGKLTIWVMGMLASVWVARYAFFDGSDSWAEPEANAGGPD